MPTTIITREQGGIVPLSHTTIRVKRPADFLLCHYTGSSGPSTTDGLTDRQHMERLQSSAIAAGKTWEYNYVITPPTGQIWEMAGEFRAAHCANANDWSYGVQMNLGVGDPPNAAMIESWRWLSQHLVDTGQITQAVHDDPFRRAPHYRLKATQCCGGEMANPAGASWASPTGEGSLGNLLPFMLVPWASPATQGDDTEVGCILKTETGARYYSSGTFVTPLNTASEVAARQLLIGFQGGNTGDLSAKNADIAAGVWGVNIDVITQAIAKLPGLEAATNALKADVTAIKGMTDPEIANIVAGVAELLSRPTGGGGTGPTVAEIAAALKTVLQGTSTPQGKFVVS